MYKKNLYVTRLKLFGWVLNVIEAFNIVKLLTLI